MLPILDETWRRNFGRGFCAPWRGFIYLCQHPALWLYGIVPVLLNLVITALVLGLLILAVIGFMVYVHPEFPEGWLGILLEVVAALLLLALAVTLAFVLWLLLLDIFVGHSLGKLAKRVELQLGTPAEQLHDIPWRYQIADAFRDVAMLLAINGGALFLHIIPVIGSIIALAVTVYFDSLLMGAEAFDFPLALRGMRREEKWKFLNAHRPCTFGLGFAMLLFALAPVIGPILLTAVAVGAVLLYHELTPSASVELCEAPAPVIEVAEFPPSPPEKQGETS